SPFVVEPGQSTVQIAEQLFNETQTILETNGNFGEIDRFIDNAARIIGLNRGTSEEEIEKRKSLKTRLLHLYSDSYKSSIRQVNKDVRTKVSSTIYHLAQSPIELEYTGGRVALELISNVFNTSLEQDSEPLSPTSASNALQTLSNVMEVAVTNQT